MVKTAPITPHLLHAGSSTRHPPFLGSASCLEAELDSQWHSLCAPKLLFTLPKPTAHGSPAVLLHCCDRATNSPVTCFTFPMTPSAIGHLEEVLLLLLGCGFLM
mmetsp:Transcript_98196/g.204819  ORF Transcript_98196/g.204819 Transcript_98196/m.204819 type:complete len:104 (+) Transcript_98196:35-346(+)